MHNVSEEEAVSSRTLPLGVIRRFMLFRLPFLALLSYPFLIKSYVSLIYMFFGTILLSLEIEKYFSITNTIKKFHQNNKNVRLRDVLTFENYKPLVYYTIMILTLMLYITKVVLLLLSRHNEEFTTNLLSIIGKDMANDLELYFISENNLQKLLLTFLPNLGVLLMTGAVILMQSYYRNARIDTLGNFKYINISHYFFITLVVILTFSLVVTNTSIGSLIFITVIIIYFLVWSFMQGRNRMLFYPFAKLIQLLSILMLTIQHLSSISTFRVILTTNYEWSFAFFGIINLKTFHNQIQDICYVAALFMLLIVTTYYADLEKAKEIRQIFQNLVNSKHRNVEFGDHSSESITNNKETTIKRIEDDEKREDQKIFEEVEQKSKVVIQVPQNKDQSDEEEGNFDTRTPAQRRLNRKQTWRRSLMTKVSRATHQSLSIFKNIRFILRVSQLGLILIVCRYNTVFSLPLMVWLFTTSLTYNAKILYYTTVLIGLPSSIFKFYAFYYSEVNNVTFNSFIPTWLGNIQTDPSWLKLLLTFSLLILFCNYSRHLKSAMKSESSDNITFLEDSRSNSILGSYSLTRTVITIFLKNTYYLSLINLYLIGTYKVSIFNLVLVAFSIIFFLSERIARRFWVLLLSFAISVITSRYIWDMGWFYVDTQSKSFTVLNTVLGLVGVIDNTDSEVPLGTHQDQYTSTNYLFWALFFFVLLQYDVYRTKMMKAQKKSNLEILQEFRFIQERFPNFSSFAHTCHSLYYQGIIWFGYVVITIILCTEDFNLLMMIQMGLLCLIFVTHIFKIRKESKAAHSKMLSIWDLFVFSNAVVTSIKYLYSFTAFSIIHDAVSNAAEHYSIVSFIVREYQFIGILQQYNLRTVLIGEIFVLVFSVSMRSVFCLHKSFYKANVANGPLARQSEDMNDPTLNTAPLLDPIRLHKQQTEKDIYLNYMTISLFDQWSKLAKVLEMISYFSTLFIFIYVIILSTCFRLSISLLIMLSIFCYYFYRINSAAIGIFNKKKAIQKIEIFMTKFRDWYALNERKCHQLETDMFYNEKNFVFVEFVRISVAWRYRIWRYVFLLSVSVFWSTYLCRMFSLDLFKQEIYYAILPQIRAVIISISFVLGIYSEDKGFLRENYPFAILIALCVIELKLTQILERNMEKRLIKPFDEKEDSVLGFYPETQRYIHVDPQSADIESSAIVLKTEESKHTDEKNEVANESLISHNSENEQLAPQEIRSESNNLKVYSDLRHIGGVVKALISPFKLRKDLSTKGMYISSEVKRDEYTYQSGFDSFAIPKTLSETQKKTLKSYYQNSYIYLKLQVINGLSAVVARLVLFIMLFNATNKENIFGIYYLIGSYIVWKINRFNIKTIIKITNFTIILLLLQYSLLVFNINNLTSPRAIPDDIHNTSIIAYVYGSNIISENQFLKVLGIGFKFSDTKSLIGDCLTFLILQLFVWSFVLKAEYIFNRLSRKVGFIQTEEENQINDVWIKKNNIWRSPAYGYLKISVRFLTLYSSRITVLMLSAIALFNVSLSNLVLASVFLFDIVLIDFSLIKIKIEQKVKFMSILFKISQSCIFIFFTLFAVNNLPFNISPFVNFDSAILDKNLIFIILQLHIDLIQADDFVNAYEKNMVKSSLRGRLVALCKTYHFNDNKLYKYLHDYLNKKELNQKLTAITERISTWNDQFFNEAKFDVYKRAQELRISVSKKEDVAGRPESTYLDIQEVTYQKEESIGDEEPEPEKEDEMNSSCEEQEESVPLKSKEHSIWMTIKIRLIKSLVSHKDHFLFGSTYDLFKCVIQKNRKLLKEDMKEFYSFNSKDSDQIARTIDYIEEFYNHLEKEIQENPTLNVLENVSKLSDKGFHRPSNTEYMSSQLSIDMLQDRIPESSKASPTSNIWDAKVNLKDVDDPEQTEEFEKYSVFETVKLVFHVWLSHWEYFCYFMLIVYQIQAQGMIMLIIPFAIFGYAITEENRCVFKFWSFTCGFVVLITIIKFAQSCISFSADFLTKMLGPNNNIVFEVVLVLILLIQITLLKKSGFDHKSEINIESINRAFLRKKLNNDMSETKKRLEQFEQKNHDQVFVREIQEIIEQNPRNMDLIISEVEPDFVKALIKFPKGEQNNYFFRLFSFYNKKTGSDVYPFIAIVQLIIAIYILIFYSSMEKGRFSDAITETFKFNEFSGAMVVTLFLHMAVVILDRRIILANDKKQEKNATSTNRQSGKRFKRRLERSESQFDQKIEKAKGLTAILMSKMADSPSLVDEAFHSYALFTKFILQILLIAVLNYFIYQHLQVVQNTSNYIPFSDITTIIFYILYSIYFTLSALQLRNGIPAFTGRMALMNSYSLFNSISFKVYRSIPFLFEIKTFMDWTFTTTALDLFQWLKLEDIYGQLFLTKIETDNRFKRDLGQRIDRFSKFTMGCCGIFAFLLIILGPLLLFSTYNPLGEDNSVIGATVSVGFKIGDNYFTIFENSHVSTIQDYNSIDYNTQKSLQEQQTVRDAGVSSVQNITMSPFSEQTWSIAKPNYDMLITELNKTISQLDDIPLSKLNQTSPISLQLDIQFLQSQTQKNNIASTISTISYSFYNSDDSDAVKDTMNSLLNIISCSNSDALLVPEFYYSLMRLGAQQPPMEVKLGAEAFQQDIYIKMICPDQSAASNNKTYQIADSYWEVLTKVDDSNRGLIFYTITNKVPSFLVSFSIQAFYLGIVLVISNAIRNALSGQIQNLTLSDLPAANELIQICEGILIARAEKDLIKEERLYWELIDILRSPEVIKLITRSAAQEKLSKRGKLKSE